jgi:hypothetical protein
VQLNEGGWNGSVASKGSYTWNGFLPARLADLCSDARLMLSRSSSAHSLYVPIRVCTSREHPGNQPPFESHPASN